MAQTFIKLFESLTYSVIDENRCSDEFAKNGHHIDKLVKDIGNKSGKLDEIKYILLILIKINKIFD